jgi:hypothetical protein
VAAEAEQGEGDDGLGGFEAERSAGDEPDLGVHTARSRQVPVRIAGKGQL